MPWEIAPNDVQLLLCTTPDADSAQRLADYLIGQHLAACVNIVPQLLSVYRWQGRVCREPEILLLIKTTIEQTPAVADAITAIHPYANPEVVALSLTGGLSAYLDWLRQACQADIH